MGLLNFKPKATAAEKNEVNKELSHLETVMKKLNTTDKIDTYFSNFEEMLYTYGRLNKLEESYNWHGQYKWDGGVKKSLINMEAKRPAAEQAFVDRAYERLQRDCLKLSSEAAKDKKRTQFFTELEHYYKYLSDETIAYVNNMK